PAYQTPHSLRLGRNARSGDSGQQVLNLALELLACLLDAHAPVPERPGAEEKRKAQVKVAAAPLTRPSVMVEHQIGEVTQLPAEALGDVVAVDLVRVLPPLLHRHGSRGRGRRGVQR